MVSNLISVDYTMQKQVSASWPDLEHARSTRVLQNSTSMVDR